MEKHLNQHKQTQDERAFKPRAEEPAVDDSEAFGALERDLERVSSDKSDELAKELEDVLPCEAAGSEVAALYADYSAASTQAVRDVFLVELLELHPFVKKGDPKVVAFPLHTVETSGFILNVRGFQRWLKTKPGLPFKKRGGGVSDDALYTLSPLLRELVPRGLHIITATHKATHHVTRFWFRGIPKFTGLTSNDEDEASNSHEANFFFNGKTMADAHHLCVTRKSNGENAKLSAACLDGEWYLLCGSKNTCFLWPANEHGSVYHPLPAYEPPEENTMGTGGHGDIGPNLTKLYSDWFGSRSKVEQKQFLEEMVHRGYT